ncbi:hypothetical protein B0H34DRAFT_860372 [Crassisporium funariophilum]|nr:hypothetical protein B0H34DRAFT_860372 [Crassisporium funariophilum]
MPPTKDDYTLLNPAQTAELADSSGQILYFPIFTILSTGKIYVQCDKCQNFFLLNLSRIPTNLANHRGRDTCLKAAQRLQQERIRSLATSEATLAVNIFNRQNTEVAGSASFTRARSELTTASETTPTSSVPTTPTISNPYPLFLNTHTSNHNSLIDVNEVDILTNSLQLDSSDLPQSSPPSVSEYLGNEDTMRDELPPLAEFTDSDDELEDDNLNFASDKLCKEERVEWTPGSVWDTFPYQQHADNTIGWKPFLLDSDKWIQLRSNECKKYLTTHKERELQACVNCLKIPNSASFRKCIERLKDDAAPHTPWRFLTPYQTRGLLLASRKQNNLMKLKVWDLL